MEPLDSLNRWSERARDRARMSAFVRFVWKRFLGDQLFAAAGALSFTTVFALVPLSMVVFGVLSAFPVFDQWSSQLLLLVVALVIGLASLPLWAHLRHTPADPHGVLVKSLEENVEERTVAAAALVRRRTTYASDRREPEQHA